VTYLEQAVASALSGELGALVTAPINKQRAAKAGFCFAGHTEFLAHRLAVPSVAMMFVGPRLRVVLVTVHTALVAVSAQMTRQRVVEVTALAVRALIDDFGVNHPRVGVLGLNPHAGEGGQFGSEEETVIGPAIQDLRRQFAGVCTFSDPLPPDSAYRQPWDLFVAMYHDQALIPVKLLDFERTVNVTLGLPIIRTSPDHGVAYDIAGTGRADATPFSYALALAVDLLDRRRRVSGS
jgi:4-hydroxythreonine-4-phosphate dehydrogenase